MEEFFKSTAWQMETPTSYGAFHLIFSIVGLTLAILLAYFLRKTNDKQNRILMLVVSVFLIVCEVYKQLFYVFVIGNGQYQWWIFPFQLCSLPMYICLFCAICKNDKINNWLYEFMFAFNLFGGFIAFLEPSGINHAYVTLTLHAYIWHLMLVFIGFYLYFSKRACNNAKGYVKGLTCFVVSAGIAQIFNVALHTFGGVNMFFISPYYRSSLIVFEDIYANCGWLVNMILYIIALILAGAIVFYSALFFRKLKEKQNKNKQQV